MINRVKRKHKKGIKVKLNFSFFIILSCLLTNCSNISENNNIVILVKGSTVLLNETVYICQSCTYEIAGTYSAHDCRDPISDTYASKIVPAFCTMIPRDSIHSQDFK